MIGPAEGEALRRLIEALEPLLDNANGYDKSNVRGVLLAYHGANRPDLLDAEERARIAWKELKALAPLSGPVPLDVEDAIQRAGESGGSPRDALLLAYRAGRDAALSGPVDASGEPAKAAFVDGFAAGQEAAASAGVNHCSYGVEYYWNRRAAAAVPSSPAQEPRMTTSTGVMLTVERYNDLLEGERGLWATVKAHGKLVAALMKIRDNAAADSVAIARDALATDLREIDWSAFEAALPPSSPVADSPTDEK